MLELAQVTLICADTANHALALRALERSRERVRFARVLLLTDAVPGGIAVPDGVEVRRIAPLQSRDDYSRLMLKGLRAHVETSHALVVQWDGYVLNPDAWDPALLETDYVGAKWFWYRDGHTVGNGGFSLRSRRLLDALADPRVELVEAEDITIGRACRDLLERDHGVRFATEAQADRFAFEAAYPIGMPFGFHGLFNFARVVPEAELAALAPRFSDAIARSPQLAQLVRNCVALGQWSAAGALAARRMEAAPDDAEARALLEQSRAGAARGPVVGRNDPCPCGSGRRYKHCHGAVGATSHPTDDAGTVRPASLPPTDADALARAGMAAHQRGDLATAQREYEAALRARPGDAVATHYLGVLAYQRDDLATALPLLEQSARAVPDEAEFHNNLGLALAAADRLQDAIAAYERAVALRPSHAGAWSNLGLARTARNELVEAIADLRRAIALAPDLPAAHWNLALALLARGDYAAAWPEYEWRLRIREFRPDHAPSPAPRWNGEPIAGKRLLVVAEQGLGDTLHFIRYAIELARRGAFVIARVPSKLARLMATVPGVAEVNVRETVAASADFQIPLMSIPGALGVTAGEIFAPVPYLAVDATLREHAVRDIRGIAAGRAAVGLAWSGAQRNTNDRRRSMQLATLAPLLAQASIAWFSLQHDDDEAVASVPAAAALTRLPQRIDFDGMAAMIDVLDLVVTVDTSVAHVAGALGKPVWILLPFAADWRWGLAHASSRWYPTARLFRQHQPGDWSGVVARVRSELAGVSPP
jgi:tetratricopeptide (TPR) repeat protein